MTWHDLVQCILWGFVIAFAQATLWAQGGPAIYFMVMSVVTPALCGIIFGLKKTLRELTALQEPADDDKTVE